MPPSVTGAGRALIHKYWSHALVAIVVGPGSAVAGWIAAPSRSSEIREEIQAAVSELVDPLKSEILDLKADRKIQDLRATDMRDIKNELGVVVRAVARIEGKLEHLP